MFILCDEKRFSVLAQRINADTRRTEKVIINPKMDLEEIFTLKTEIIAFNSHEEAERFLSVNSRELSETRLNVVEIEEIENVTSDLTIHPIVIMGTLKNFILNFRKRNEIIFYIKHINKHLLDLRYIIGTKSYKLLFQFDDALEIQSFNKSYMRRFIPEDIIKEGKA